MAETFDLHAELHVWDAPGSRPGTAFVFVNFGNAPTIRHEAPVELVTLYRDELYAKAKRQIEAAAGSVLQGALRAYLA